GATVAAGPRRTNQENLRCLAGKLRYGPAGAAGGGEQAAREQRYRRSIPLISMLFFRSIQPVDTIWIRGGVSCAYRVTCSVFQFWRQPVSAPAFTRRRRSGAATGPTPRPGPVARFPQRAPRSPSPVAWTWYSIPAPRNWAA